MAASSQENDDDQQGNTEDPMMQEIEETNQTISSSGEVPASESSRDSKCVVLPVKKTFTLKDPANKICTVGILMFSCYGFCDSSFEYSRSMFDDKMKTYILKKDVHCKCCEPVKQFSVYSKRPVICEEGHLWTGKNITFDMPIECGCQSCIQQAGLEQRSTGYHVTQPV